LEISVLMAVHNGEAEIGPTLDSLAAALPSAAEIVLVDDGSTDGTARLAEARRDLPLRLVRLGHAGQTAALNHGLKLAAGRYVARLDCGDLCHPERLTRQRDYLDAHPELLLVGCRVRRLDREGRPLGLSEVVCDPLPLQRGLMRINLFQHSSLMIRRDACLAVGGYRPFFRHSQDLDLLLRLSERGPLGNLLEALSDWRIDPDSVSFRHRRSQAAYARLARSCARDRRAGRPDPVDEGGAAVPDLPVEDAASRLAHYHLELARALLMGDRPAEARRELARARTQGLPRRGTLVLGLLAALPAPVRRLLRRLRVAWLTR
jgi:glycosyltransferase involved in cell wall biosynthesis